ncbi:hypothetical protein OBBRIDRAFT_795908 [Obba rivulosa]|uniref:Uncharacterized protein n=1 Tax=Obba rivulosa TaxID=1052685 RepID=A0A8E2DH36_9APHY|nr:hypothetical protein OBBRIDRAFT_795908 [Obba rivulosa]
MPTIHITTPASMASESVPNSPSPILAPRMQPPATLLLRNSTADAGKVAKLRERYLELQDRRMIEQQIKDGRRVSLYTPPPAPSTKPADIRVRISGSLESMCSSVSDPLPAAAPQNDTSVTSNESPWSRSILSKAHQVRMPVLAAQEEIKTIKSEEEPKKVKSEEELNEVKREGEPKIRREEPKITRDEEVKKAKSEPYDEAITRVLAMPISPEERREKQGGSVPSAPAAAIPVAAETKSKVTDRVSSVVKRASRVLQVSAPFKSSGNRTENNIPRASSTQPPPRVAPPPRATPTTRGTPPPRAAPPPRANPPPRTTSTTRVTPPPRTTSTTRVTPPPRATPPLRATQSLRATPPLRATQPLRATRLPPRILNTSKVAPPEDKPTGERPQREVRPTWSFRAARPTTPRVEKPPCRCERHQRNIARHTDADMRRSMTFGKENSGTPQATPAKTGEQKSVAAPKSDDQKIQRGRQPLGMRPDLANYGDVVSFGQVGEQIMCASSSFA